jgi:hypothetical protein
VIIEGIFGGNFWDTHHFGIFGMPMKILGQRRILAGNYRPIIFGIHINFGGMAILGYTSTSEAWNFWDRELLATIFGIHINFWGMAILG